MEEMDNQSGHLKDEAGQPAVPGGPSAQGSELVWEEWEVTPVPQRLASDRPAGDPMDELFEELVAAGPNFLDADQEPGPQSPAFLQASLDPLPPVPQQAPRSPGTALEPLPALSAKDPEIPARALALLPTIQPILEAEDATAAEVEIDTAEEPEPAPVAADAFTEPEQTDRIQIEAALALEVDGELADPPISEWAEPPAEFPELSAFDETLVEAGDSLEARTSLEGPPPIEETPEDSSPAELPVEEAGADTWLEATPPLDLPVIEEPLAEDSFEDLLAEPEFFSAAEQFTSDAEDGPDPALELEDALACLAPAVEEPVAEEPVEEPMSMDALLSELAIEYGEPEDVPEPSDFLELSEFDPQADSGSDGFDEPIEEPQAFDLDPVRADSGQPLPAFLADADLSEVYEPSFEPPLDELIQNIDAELERAPALVAPAEPLPVLHRQYSQLDDYVVFGLSGTDYAVPVRDIAEIGRVPSITRIPNVPAFIRGITNLRGEVVPVLNLPALLGLQESVLSARGRVLFLQARERVAATGLLVDEVKGIQRIPSQQLEQVTGLVDDKVTAVLRGVHGRGDRLLNVMDLEQLFQLQEFRQLEAPR